MGIFDGFLTQLGTGDQVKDFTHASKLFHDNNNTLYPKMGYLYHVFFEIDDAVRKQGSVPDAATEVGMLVKSVDLPKFTIDNKTLNSYGRASIVQNKVHYDPVTIQFHDDSADRVRTLWAEYYAYYYRDMDGGVDKRGSISNVYLGKDGKYDEKRENVYGFTPLTETDRPKNFIKAIRIYSLHQKRFSEYILVNPIITSFRHGQHQAGQAEPMQHEMTISYEFVLYADGNIKKTTIPSFANLHYDNKPSPLTPANGTQSILGPGGIFDTADDVINSIPSDPLGAALKTFRGLKNIGSMDLKQAAIGELSQMGMDILRGDNPLNRIAVPAITDLSSIVQGTQTTIDNVDLPGAVARGAAVSNGSATGSIPGLLAVGTSLLAAGAPQTVAGLGLLFATGKTLYNKATTPAQTSTPPSPSQSDTHP